MSNKTHKIKKQKWKKQIYTHYMNILEVGKSKSLK